MTEPTHTIPDLDEALDVNLDELWEESIPCVVNDCQTDVVWRVTFKCCGWSAFACDPHKVRADRIWRSLEAQGKIFKCEQCQHKGLEIDKGIIWTPV